MEHRRLVAWKHLVKGTSNRGAPGIRNADGSWPSDWEASCSSNENVQVSCFPAWHTPARLRSPPNLPVAAIDQEADQRERGAANQRARRKEKGIAGRSTSRTPNN